jgi:hypothetical protein
VIRFGFGLPHPLTSAAFCSALQGLSIRVIAAAREPAQEGARTLRPGARRDAPQPPMFCALAALER